MIFFITGPDTYRARRKLFDLRDKFSREVDASGLNLQTVDGSTVTVADLRHHLETFSFLARRRFIVFENLLIHKKTEILDAVLLILKKMDKDSNVIVFFETNEPISKHALLPWLKKNSYFQSFDLLAKSQQIKFVEDEFKLRGRSIVPSAISLILNSTSDTWQIINAIEKIDAYLPVGSTVENNSVSVAVSEKINDNIFDLVDALIRNDIKKGAKLLMDQLAQGLSPQQLIALLETQLRILLLLSETQGRSLNVPGVHPYVVKKLSPLASKVNFEHIKNVYAGLADLDISLKTIQIDPKTALLNFITKWSSLVS